MLFTVVFSMPHKVQAGLMFVGRHSQVGEMKEAMGKVN
jgi:hypothetical protein